MQAVTQLVDLIRYGYLFFLEQHISLYLTSKNNFIFIVQQNTVFCKGRKKNSLPLLFRFYTELSFIVITAFCSLLFFRFCFHRFIIAFFTLNSGVFYKFFKSTLTLRNKFPFDIIIQIIQFKI